MSCDIRVYEHRQKSIFFNYILRKLTMESQLYFLNDIDARRIYTKKVPLPQIRWSLTRRRSFRGSRRSKVLVNVSLERLLSLFEIYSFLGRTLYMKNIFSSIVMSCLWDRAILKHIFDGYDRNLLIILLVSYSFSQRLVLWRVFFFSNCYMVI